MHNPNLSLIYRTLTEQYERHTNRTQYRTLTEPHKSYLDVRFRISIFESLINLDLVRKVFPQITVLLKCRFSVGQALPLYKVVNGRVTWEGYTDNISNRGGMLNI